MREIVSCSALCEASHKADYRSASGYAWRHGGWLAVLGLDAVVLIVSPVVGLYEMRASRDVGER